ncbi:MAG: hypothetical protein ACI9G1_003399 [Pirellulaceae bacterium]|jgi:hypothetical protein
MYRTFTLTLLVLLAAQTVFAADKDKSNEEFNGKNLDGWKLKGNNAENSKWVVGVAEMDPKENGKLVIAAAKKDGQLVNGTRGVDIYTSKEFGDCIVTLELMVPKGSNSGIYLMGNYEIQILDSFGKANVGPGDIGGIYGAAAPSTNAAGAPGTWQTFQIDFSAPKFKDGKKVANAKFNRVVLNGKVIHEGVEVKGVTGGSLGKGEQPTGPLMFQGDHGPVAFRKIVVTPK